jgi:hypothetical protein
MISDCSASQGKLKEKIHGRLEKGQMADPDSHKKRKLCELKLNNIVNFTLNGVIFSSSQGS